MKKITTLFVMFTLSFSGLLPLLSAQSLAQIRVAAQDQRLGRIVRSYSEAQDQQKQKQQRPAWVENALERTMQHFRVEQKILGLPAREIDLKLLSAVQDDLGHTHVRMNQMHNGVGVLGGQLIAHLDDKSMLSVSGRMFAEARIDTTPALTAQRAIAAATVALGFTGQFSREPAAILLVLPHQLFKGDGASGATLVYQVELRVEDGASRPAHHQYFVDARDGSIVWHYDSLPSVLGHGYSLYSGYVRIETQSVGTATEVYRLRDPLRGNSEVRNMGNGTTGDGEPFFDADNQWGDNSTGDPQTVAVDAHYGVQMSWDYFRNRYNWNGVNGNGLGITSKVHYGSNFRNAFGSKDGLAFGDGNATASSNPSNPWVSLDVVGHEYTHAVIDYMLDNPNGDDGFIYAGESGAVEESFADIFGTRVEHSDARRADNYLIFEDGWTPGTSGDAMRDMANPQNAGDPDHYSIRVNQGACTPTFDTNGNPTNDYCGVHTNSSIMNHAFYLLAEGGTHRLSGITVPRMGPETAEWIFFHALRDRLTRSARFEDVRKATLEAAAIHFPNAPWVRQAVARAWAAVGVGDPLQHRLDSITLTGPADWNTMPVATSVGDGNFSVTNGYVGDFASWASQGAAKLTGDFNGDGRTDIALTGPSGWNTLPVAFSNGNGTFTVTNRYVGDFATWASQGATKLTGDFNGDGKTDIALTGRSGWWTLPVAFSNGDGSFDVKNLAVGDFANWAAQDLSPIMWKEVAKILTGDFNGDGKTDIALTGPSSWWTLPVAFSKGDGSFDVRNLPANNFATWSAEALQSGGEALVGDFDGDGADDICLIGPSSWTTVPVAFSNWHGAFAVHNIRVTDDYGVQFTLYVEAARMNKGVVRVGDFNGDLKADIAVIGIPYLPVAFSNISPVSNGGFIMTVADAVDFGSWAKQACNNNGSVLTGDFNRDGRTDIALTGTPGWWTLPVVFSNGNGTFNVTNGWVGDFATWSAHPQVTRLAGKFR